MGTLIRAIETNYRGFKFKSRLEARWAIFFDALDIKWEYELEGYKLSDGQWYLPDFYLPYFNGGVYVEVKPDDNYDNKAKQFSIDSKNAILMAVGCPELKIYTLFFGDKVEEVVFSSEYINGGHKDEYRFFYWPGWIPDNYVDFPINKAINHAKQAIFEHKDNHGQSN